MATTLCCCAWTDAGRLFRASRTANSTSGRGESSDGAGTPDGLGEAEGDPATLDPCPQPARTRVSQTNPLFTRGYFTATCTSRPPSHSPLRERAGVGVFSCESRAGARLSFLLLALTYTAGAAGCSPRPACCSLYTR